MADVNVADIAQQQDLSAPVSQEITQPEVQAPTEVPTTEPQQEDPPYKALWKKLRKMKDANGQPYYTKNLKEFSSKYSDNDQVDFLYNVLKTDKADGFVDKTSDDFYNEYFPDLKKNKSQEPVDGTKLPVDGTTVTSPAPLESTSQLPKEEVKIEEPISNDVISLVQKKNNLTTAPLLTDVSQVDNYQNQVSSINQSLRDNGIDDKTQALITQDLAGISPAFINQNKSFLSRVRDKNPAVYSNLISIGKIEGLVDTKTLNEINSSFNSNGIGVVGATGETEVKGIGSPEAVSISGLPVPVDANQLFNGLNTLDNYTKEAKNAIDNSTSENKDEANNIIANGASTYIYNNVSSDGAKAYLSQKISGEMDYKEPVLIPNPAADPDIERKTFGSQKYDPLAPKFIEQKQQDFGKDNDLDKYSLSAIRSKLDPNSTVDQMVFDIYAQKEGVEDAFKKANQYPSTGDRVADAAINYAISLDPNLKAQYDALGGKLPVDKVAEITNGFLNNPTVDDVAAKFNFAGDIEKAKANFNTNFPEFAKNKVASIISQRREDDGENNRFLNLPTQTSVDKTVKALVSEGKLTKEEADIYKTEIRTDLDFLHYFGRTLTAPIGGGAWNPNPIQTQELVGGGVSGYGGALKGIYKTGSALTNLTLGGQILNKYTDLGHRLLSDDSKLARMMSEGTVGQLHAVGANATWNGIGSFMGMAAALAMGGAELKAFGVAAESAGEAAAFQSFMGDEYEKALLNHPGKTIEDNVMRTASTVLHTAIMTFATRYLPIDKATKGITNALKLDVDNTIQQFATGKITIEEAKKSIGTKVYDWAKSTGGHSLTSGVTLSLMNAANSLTGKLLGEDTRDVSKIVNDTVDEFIPTVISSVGVSAFAALGTKQGKVTAKNVWDIASNPEYYLARLEKMAENNPNMKGSLNDIKENINIVADTKNSLDDPNFNNLSQEQKQKYIVLTLQENAWSKKATSTSDVPMAKKFADISQKFRQSKEDIINNKDKAVELGKPKEDVTEVAPEMKQGENIAEVDAVVKNFEKVIADSQAQLKTNPDNAEATGAMSDAQIKLDALKKDPVAYFTAEKEKTLADLQKAIDAGATPEEVNIKGVTENYDNLINQAKAYGEKNATGVSGVVGTGQAAIQDESQQGTGTEKTGAGGVLQAQGTEGEGAGVGQQVGEVKVPEQIEQLRADEQTELDSKIPNAEQYRVDGKVDRTKLTNEEDIKAFDETYNKYDKLITPLLKEAELPTASVENTTKALEEKISKGFKKEIILPTSMVSDLAEMTIPDADSDYNKELELDIKKNGIKSPIKITHFTEDNTYAVTDGNHRLIIAKKLGIKNIPVEIVESRSDSKAAFPYSEYPDIYPDAKNPAKKISEISEAYHKKDNPELTTAVNEVLGVSELPQQKGVGVGEAKTEAPEQKTGEKLQVNINSLKEPNLPEKPSQGASKEEKNKYKEKLEKYKKEKQLYDEQAEAVRQANQEVKDIFDRAELESQTEKKEPVEFEKETEADVPKQSIKVDEKDKRPEALTMSKLMINLKDWLYGNKVALGMSDTLRTGDREIVVGIDKDGKEITKTIRDEGGIGFPFKSLLDLINGKLGKDKEAMGWAAVGESAGTAMINAANKSKKITGAELKKHYFENLDLTEEQKQRINDAIPDNKEYGLVTIYKMGEEGVRSNEAFSKEAFRLMDVKLTEEEKSKVFKLVEDRLDKINWGDKKDDKTGITDKEKYIKQLKSASTFEELEQILNGDSSDMSLGTKAEIMQKIFLGTEKTTSTEKINPLATILKEKGITIESISKTLEEPIMKGIDAGQPMILIAVDPDSKVVKDNERHPNYSYGVKGFPIGLFNKTTQMHHISPEMMDTYVKTATTTVDENAINKSTKEGVRISISHDNNGNYTAELGKGTDKLTFTDKKGVFIRNRDGKFCDKDGKTVDTQANKLSSKSKEDLVNLIDNKGYKVSDKSKAEYKQNISGLNLSNLMQKAKAGIISFFKDPKITAQQKLVKYINKAFPNIKVVLDKKEFDKKQDDYRNKKILNSKQEIFGVVDGETGSIYLNPILLNNNTSIHEFSHIFNIYAKKYRPEIYKKGMDLISKESKYFDSILNNTSYQKMIKDIFGEKSLIKNKETGNYEINKSIENYNDINEYVADEALNTAIGDRGELFANEAQRRDFVQWLSKLYEAVKQIMGFDSMTVEQFEKLDLKQFVDAALKEMLSGKEISGITSEEVSGIIKDKPKLSIETEKESKVPEQKEEETGISKAAVKEKYDFVQTFDVKTDQDVADNAMNNLAISAERNKMSLNEQAENDMLRMIDKTGEASEQDIMTAAFYLNSLDKKIKTANENGENANILLAKRDATLEILRKLGNNAGRNLRLFGSVYKNVEGNRLEAVRAELKKNLNVADIPQSMHDLSLSKMSGIDKAKVEPYVKAIEQLNKDLNEIKANKDKDVKKFNDAELEDYVKKELEKRMKEKNAEKPEKKYETKARKVAKNIMNAELPSWMKGINDKGIKKSGLGAEEVKKMLADAVVSVGKLLDKGVEFSQAIKEAVKGLVDVYGEDNRDGIEKGVEAEYNKSVGEAAKVETNKKEVSITKIKAIAESESATTITSDMVTNGYINDVVNGHIESDIPYDKVITAATEELKNTLPDVTEQEVSDALLKRGDFKQETKKQLENKAEQKKKDVIRLAKVKNNLEALESGLDIDNIKNDNSLTPEQKKQQIEKRKSEYEKEVDAKIKKIEQDKKDAEAQNVKANKEKEALIAEQKSKQNKIDALNKQLSDVIAGIKKQTTPRPPSADVDIANLEQQIKDAKANNVEQDKIDKLTKKLSDLRAGIIATPVPQVPSQDSPIVANLKAQIKVEEDALRETANAVNKAQKIIDNTNTTLSGINAEIQYVKTNKSVFNSAIKDPKDANAQIVKAKEELKAAYGVAGIRLESGSKTEIKIAQDAEKEINKIKNDNNLSEETKKEHIEDIEKQRDKDLQGTKQSVLTSLKDNINSVISDLSTEHNDAVDNDNTNQIESISEIKKELENLSANLSPNKENLKDQIDKADQDLSALINSYKGTPYEGDLKNIQDKFRESWQKTSDDIQRQMLIDKAVRNRKETERKINAGQYTEIPTTPFDAKRDQAVTIAEAEAKKAWSRLNSLSMKAKEQQETKGAVSKWLKFRRDWMIMSPGAIEKVAGSGFTKPIIDPFIKQTAGRISGLITGIKPVKLSDIGKTLPQFATKESASNHISKTNDNYITSIINYDKAVRDFGADSKQATDAKSKMDDAELDKDASLALLFISAGSHMDIAQIMRDGATDFDAKMGKYKQSFPSERGKVENAWYWIESLNRTHGAIKSISHRQAIMDEYRENLQYVQAKDGTITNEGRQEAWDLAVLRGEAGRFGEDTWMSKKIGGLKSSESGGTRNLGNWLFPVAKIGINITKQGLDMAFPGVELAYKASKDGILKGYDELPLQQKKYINTLVTRGLFGLAQYAMVGYLLSSGNMKYGGAYNPNDRKKVLGSDGKILDHGEWEINGERMPEIFNIVFNHSPYALPASIAAQGFNKSKQGEYYKMVTGAVNEVYERLPLQATADLIGGLLGDKFKMQKAVASQVPTMRATAEYFDKDEEGNTREVETKSDNYVIATKNMVQKNLPGFRNLMETKPVLFKDSEINTDKTLIKLTSAGVELPDIGAKEFSVNPDAAHPEGTMTKTEKDKFIQKVKANYSKEMNDILNEKWEGTNQKTGEIVNALGSDLSKFKGDIKRATTAIQEMSQNAFTKSWTKAYKEMGLEKGATTEYKWKKTGGVLFEEDEINKNPKLKELKDAGVIFKGVEAKSDIQIDKNASHPEGELTPNEYDAYKKEFKKRALKQIAEVLMIPQLETKYLPAAKKSVPTGGVAQGISGLSKISEEKDGKTITLLQSKIDDALSSIKNEILRDMGLVIPPKSWKSAANVPSDRGDVPVED